MSTEYELNISPPTSISRFLEFLASVRQGSCHFRQVSHITVPLVLSLDATDVSGEHMREISHNIVKIRLDEKGIAYPDQEVISDLKNELSRISVIDQPGYCGSCYGGELPKGGCCNTCDEVRKSYLDRGWAFSTPDNIEQCKKEGWTEKVQAQAKDGCRIAGRVRIKKVQSSLVFSFGQSFQSNGYHVMELVPYLKDGPVHDFGHIIHKLNFESDDEYNPQMADAALRVKKKLGVDVNPLDGHHNHNYRHSGVCALFYTWWDNATDQLF